MTVLFRLGDLDRRVRFERKAPTPGLMSAGKEAWVLVAEVSAQVQDVLPSRAEAIDNGLTMATRRARVRMRFRTDITADMRVTCGGRAMQIIAGPVELGRREGLELMVEDYSTAGGAA